MAVLCRYRRSGVAVAGEAVVDDGGDDEREEDREEEAADDSDGEGLKHLGACSKCEGQGEHATYGGDGGQDDGAETALGGVEHGLAGRVPARGPGTGVWL